MKENKRILTDGEIDLAVLAELIWSRKITIYKAILITFFIGLFIALTSKSEFECVTKLLPERQDGASPDLGGLGGLAGLAGFDLSGLGNSRTLSPEMYPEIARSSPFLEELVHSPIYFEYLDTTIASYEYFKEFDSPSGLGYLSEFTIGLPRKILVFFKDSSNAPEKNYPYLFFTKEKAEIIQKFRDRFSINVDSKSGTILISTKMPDPFAAAMLADLLVNKLTQQIEDYKVKKSRRNLAFIKDQFEKAKNEYELSQEEIANFTNKNRNISNSLVKAQYDRLQNELSISFEVYKGLASQLEQAKIKVEENTPVFTVFEPVKIPNSKSEPKRGIIIIASILFGAVLGVGIVFFKVLVIHNQVNS